jgi:hypothetical protein
MFQLGADNHLLLSYIFMLDYAIARNQEEASSTKGLKPSSCKLRHRVIDLTLIKIILFFHRRCPSDSYWCFKPYFSCVHVVVSLGYDNVGLI